MVCNKQLSTGEELYVIDENKFVCKDDYLSSGAIKEVNLNSGKRSDSRPALRFVSHSTISNDNNMRAAEGVVYFNNCGSLIFKKRKKGRKKGKEKKRKNSDK